MARDNYSALLAFVTVAREGSFTRAAAQLGVSQSALSHTIRNLESTLGVRLLTRTTRNVSSTEAGEHLFRNISGPMEDIDNQVQTLSRFRDLPSGTVRITATDFAIRSILWPRLKGFLKNYPDIHVELICDYGLADIAEQRYDAGVRFGEQLAQDMIGVRIGPDERFALVCAPEYMQGRAAPTTPQDLVAHNCINLRLPTHGGLYSWEFAPPGGREVNVRVSGQLTFNGIYEILQGALDGYGLCYIPESMAMPHLKRGELIRLLEEWCPLWSGYHIYYPSRRQPSHAMSLVIDALRYEPSST